MMSHYCEKCHMLSEQDCCAVCGNKRLRTPERGDYCFFTEQNSRFCGMLGGMFQTEQIPYLSTPSGNGVRSKFALRLENQKIFVPYESFNEAAELLDNFFRNGEEAQINTLKNNIDKLFVASRSEKKMKKKLKLTEGESLSDYCAGRIKNADRIVNEGKITGCLKGGEYLFVYKEDELFTVNSATYELISAKKRK